MMEPLFARDSLQLPHVEASGLDMGSFVKYKGSTSGDCTIVKYGRLIDWKVENDLKQCLLLGYEITKNMTIAIAKDCPPQWVPCPALIDLIFVVTPFSEEEEYSWLGRLDTFVLKEETNTTAQFPCDSPLFYRPISLAKLIWVDMQRIRQTFRRLLGSSSLHQGTFNRRRENVSISPDTFAYVKRQVLENVGVSLSDGNIRQIHYELQAGFSCCSKKRVCVSEKIEFKGKEGVSRLTKLLGVYAVFGIRMRRPKVSQLSRRIHANDAIHYLVENEEQVSCMLEYAKGTGTLVVMVAYSPFMVDWVGPCHVRNPPTELLKATIEQAPTANNNTGDDDDASEDEDEDLLIGAEFQYKGHLYRVESVGPGGRCHCLSRTTNFCELSVRVVKNLERDYLE